MMARALKEVLGIRKCYMHCFYAGLSLLQKWLTDSMRRHKKLPLYPLDNNNNITSNSFIHFYNALIYSKHRQPLLEECPRYRYLYLGRIPCLQDFYTTFLASSRYSIQCWSCLANSNIGFPASAFLVTLSWDIFSISSVQTPRLGRLHTRSRPL